MSITDAVCRELQQNVEARSNGALLYLGVCRRLGTPLPESADKAPKPETVGRLTNRLKRIYGWKA